MSRKLAFLIVPAVTGLFLHAGSSAAELVDTTLSDSSQIRTATNNPFFANQADLMGVNFFYSNTQNTTNISGGAAAGTVNGVGFDNIDLDSPQGAPPPSGPFTLTQNQGGTMTAAWNFALTTSQQDRQQNAAITGADAPALASVANEFFYLGGGANEHSDVTFTFSGIGASQPVYVQIIGGDSGWFGDTVVTANGESVGVWESVADRSGETASLYAFDATSDAGGSLSINLLGIEHFSGVAGIIVSSPVPEPAAAGALAMGAIGLLRRHRRN